MEPVDHRMACPQCARPTERAYLSGRMAAVIDDSWPGGKTFENLGPEPVTCHSRSEFKHALAMRGLEEKVRHVGTPGEGSDKSAFTSRWV